jgi:hypothetical protein
MSKEIHVIQCKDCKWYSQNNKFKGHVVPCCTNPYGLINTDGHPLYWGNYCSLAEYAIKIEES